MTPEPQTEEQERDQEQEAQLQEYKMRRFEKFNHISTLPIDHSILCVVITPDREPEIMIDNMAPHEVLGICEAIMTTTRAHILRAEMQMHSTVNTDPDSKPS